MLGYSRLLEVHSATRQCLMLPSVVFILELALPSHSRPHKGWAGPAVVLLLGCLPEWLYSVLLSCRSLP